MEIFSKKIKFIAILFVGMVSLILIYDKMSYNYNTQHYMIKNLPLNGLDESPSQESQQIDAFVSDVKSFESQTNISNKGLSSQDYYHINRSANMAETNLESEHKLLVSKVLGFESKYLVPMKKLSQDSKLLYPDQIKSITVMTIGDDKCDNNYGSSLKVVIIVISRVNGFKRRNILRQSWAKRIPESKDVKLYFAIGLCNDPQIQKQIIVENNEFNDILQWNFIDNYYNLTIKSLAILRWFSLNCFRTKFLYKIDDDCIVNINNLVKFSSIALQNTIYGHLWKKAFVERKTKEKFFISKRDFRANFYPDYTGGPWLMSGAVVPLLYETAITNSLPALPYEDVYITGVVAKKAQVDRKHLTGLIYFSKSMYNKLNYCWFEENIIFWQNLDDLMIKNIWKNIESSRNSICLKTNSSMKYTKTV